MNNIKARIYIATILITVSCNLHAAAQQELPTATIIPKVNTTLSHQDILTHLLLAELAIQRNMLEVALDHYMIVTKYTNNAQVAQLTTELAIELSDPTNALIAADIWAKSAPTDLQAQLVAVTLFVNSNPDKATSY